MVEVKEQVEQALEEIRPFLVNDGGNISLVAIEGDTVIVELEGNCISCSVNQMTLQLGVCLLYTSPSPRDLAVSRMPSSA